MTAVLLAPVTGRTGRIVPAAAVVVVGVFASAAMVALPASVSMTLVAWAGVVLVAASIDARTGRLPDAVVVPGLAVALIGAAVSGRLSGAIAGAAMFGAPVLVVHLARPDGMGFGDVKFSAFLGAGIGLVAVPLVLPAYLLAAVAHVLVCSVARARDRLVPFGPSLALGSILIVLIGLVGRW
jgi:leader peptidase (prepilin peptidase)/N-methyltransferase